MRILRVPDAGTPGPPREAIEPAENPYGEVSESEIILGGCYRDLTFRSGTGEDITAEKKRMLIAQVPFNKMDLLATSWGKPTLEVMCYLSIDGDQVGKLIEPSFSTALEEGRRINFTLLQKWLKWQMEAMRATGREDQINQIVEKVLLSKMENLPSDK